MPSQTPALRDFGATYAKNLGFFEIPYRENCTHFHLLGADQASSVYNHANPALPMTVIGAPAYSPAYATLNSLKGFTTTENVTPYSYSAIIVSTSPYRMSDGVLDGGDIQAQLGATVSSYRWTSSSSDLFRCSPGAANGGDIITNTSINGGPANSRGHRHYKNLFQFVGFGEDAVMGRLVTEDGDRLQLWEGTFTSSPAKTAATMKLWGAGTGSTDITCEVAAFMIYNRLLSAAEFTAIHEQFLLPACEARGVRRGAGLF